MKKWSEARERLRIDANFGDTKEIWVIDVELDTLEDILNDILLSFVTVERRFGDIGESNLIIVTTCETRVFRIPNTQDKKMNSPSHYC